MSKISFKEGDVVRLKSGGPTMTIQSDRSNDLGYFVCSWFEGNDLKQGTFSPESLISGQDQSGSSVISSGDGGVWIG